MKKHAIVMVASVFAAFVAGCSGQEVETSGQVAAAPGVTTQGAIKIDIYDVIDESKPEENLLATVTLDKPGAFEKKVTASGSKVRFFALADANGDGKCSAGEAWAQASHDVGDKGEIKGVTLTLAAQACPAAPASTAAK